MGTQFHLKMKLLNTVQYCALGPVTVNLEDIVLGLAWSLYPIGDYSYSRQSLFLPLAFKAIVIIESKPVEK